jgi:hypothetical protein
MPTLFFLAAPAPGHSAANAEHTPQSLAQWLHGSPAAIPELFARELLQRLVAINRAPPKGKVLLDIAEVLRPGVLRSLEYLAGNIEAKTFPLPAEDRVRGDLLLGIAREFGRMYAALMLEHDSGKASDKTLAHLLQRLLRCLDHVLLGYYLLHLKTPAWLWRDVHSVYKLALVRRKHQERIRDEAAASQYATAEEVYKQILLLGLSDPYCLRPEEVLALRRASGQWTANLTLQAMKEPGWRVAFHEDRPPWWDDAPATEEDDKTLGLDVRPLLKILQAPDERQAHHTGRFEPNLATGLNPPISAGLLQYLHRRWSNAPLSRTPAKGALCFIPDFNSIHSLFGRAAPSPIDNVSHWMATPLAGDMLGYDRDTPGGVQIGLLLGYIDGDDPDVRGVGVVSRVLMDQPDGLVKFRMDSLTTCAVTAGLQPAKLTMTNQGSYQRALLYLEDVPGGEPRSFVLLQSMRQQEFNRVRLLTGNGMTFVRLINRRNVAIGIVRFDCLHAVE